MGKEYIDLKQIQIDSYNQKKTSTKLKLREKIKNLEWFFSFENELPKNWIDVNILDVTWLVTCGVAKKPNYVEEGIPFLSAQNARPFKANLNKIKFISKKQFETLTVGGKPERNDILYTRVGNCGEAAKIEFDFDFAIYVSLTLIKPIHELINSDFLVAYLNSYFGLIQASKGAIGSGLKNLNVNNVRRYRIPLPPRPEQDRIVAKVDTLMGQVSVMQESLQRIPQLLKEFRQQVLTQAVTGKLTEKWRVGKELESGDSFLKRIVSERISEGEKVKDFKPIPKEQFPFDVDDSWTFGHLQYFGEFTRGKSKHRPRNDERLFGNKYPFIQTGEVSRSNGLITEYSKSLSEFGLKQSRLFPKGTLCITIAANIAETGILDFDSCFPDSVVGYLPFKNYYDPKFAMFYIRTIQQDLEHYAPATAQKNINLGILFKVAFPVPPLMEQKEIVNCVESLFSKADTIQQQYEALKQKIDTLPQAILHKAFKGELVEQLESDGSATELLREIEELKRK